MLVAAPTGSGKTSATAQHVAQTGATCWLADRHEDVDAAVDAIEQHGGNVGRVVPLRGKTGKIPNCLHPDLIECWQAKGYAYLPGFCTPVCKRAADTEKCPFLLSIKLLEEADTIVCTKALAKRAGFFSAHGNKQRQTVVLDEDPIDLMRPAVVITRSELLHYLQTLDRLEKAFQSQNKAAALMQLRVSRRMASWCWDQIARQPPEGQPEAVAVPPSLKPGKPVLPRSKQAKKRGKDELRKALHCLMRRDPAGTVRNVYRDLNDLVERAAGQTAFATAQQLVFHLQLNIPRSKHVLILDATANVELLRPIFAPRPVEVVCDERVEPAGRIIQFMDFNGPRSYLNKLPQKLVRIIDAIGDRHPRGTLVLISHQSCLKNGLAGKSKHSDRIKTAYFGALRGRNDLEPKGANQIACHIVVGSPKTTEEARRQLALAVYGKDILPFEDLQTVQKAVLGRIPQELVDEEAGAAQHAVWEVRLKGYSDPRMQAIYDHTVTAELTHAADRARVLIHKHALVYLVTNEPCPKLWFAEMCYASDLLDLTPAKRADFEEAYQQYAAKAKELLDAGQAIRNADVCRALNRKLGWGKRYWVAFFAAHQDALEGERVFRWKGE